MSKIHSRYELFNIFTQECARAARNTEQLNMAVFQFKGGLRLNIELYRILKFLVNRLRVTNYLGWCGPCSFVILMPDTSLANALQAAAAIRTNFIPKDLLCNVDLVQYPGDFQNKINHKSKDILEVLSQGKTPIKTRIQKIFMNKKIKHLTKTNFPMITQSEQSKRSLNIR